MAELAIFSQKPFLARLLLPEADFSLQEAAGQKRVKGPLFYFTPLVCGPQSAPASFSVVSDQSHPLTYKRSQSLRSSELE